MLSPRLRAVAGQIHGRVHADVGTDHGLLPIDLIETGRVERVIAVEKHKGPLERARRALRGYPAEVRHGDGVGPLAPGEVDSLSISGMGALNMVHILSAHPDRLPARLVLQSMDEAQPIRRWALQHGFHLIEEQWVNPHCVLVLGMASGNDPAYEGLPRAAALVFGPHLLRRPGPDLESRLAGYRDWLQQLTRRGAGTHLGEPQRVLREALTALGLCYTQDSPLEGSTLGAGN